MKWSDVFRKSSPLDVESPPELNYYTRSAIFRSLIRYVSSFFFVLLLFPYSIIARKRKNPIVSENYIVTKNATERNCRNREILNIFVTSISRRGITTKKYIYIYIFLLFSRTRSKAVDVEAEKIGLKTRAGKNVIKIPI